MNETKSVKALKKQLAAAIAMVMVAAIALASSTYAWFVQSNQVTAEGMTVQAQAEGGIEIANADKGAWASTAQAKITDTTKLYPTSTSNTTNWYHAQAAAADAKTAINNTYKTLSLNDTGAGNGGSSDEFNGKQFFLVNSFFIRSTAGTSAKDLSIDKVSVTSDKADTANLDKSLRVAVKAGGNTYIYAPNGGDTTYNVWDGSSTTGPNTRVTALSGSDKQATAVNTITTEGNTEVKIYVWYEGEDAQHFSNNLATSVDSLSVTVEFSATTGESAS